MNRRSLRALSFVPSIFTAAIVGISLPPARRLYDTLIVAHNAEINQRIILPVSYKCLIMVATDKDEAPAPTKALRALQAKGGIHNEHGHQYTRWRGCVHRPQCTVRSPP